MKLTKNRLFGGLTIKLMILALMFMGLSGCSEDATNSVPAGGNDATTGVFRGDMEENVDFEFISSKNGDPDNPIEGPFSIRGKNVRYDGELGVLVVDLTVTNLGDNTFDEGVTLTFLSLLPEGVTVENPDNGENGPGAAIDFEFENDDAMWTPGEESLPRETHFGVAEGVSIGFVGRLDTGAGGDALGSIGGMVWNDANGDGNMDPDEAAIEGAEVELSAEGMEPMIATTGVDGMYTFDDLASGFYTVTKKMSEGMVPTTPGRIYVILVLEDGDVVSFLAANFGCKEDDTGPAGMIKGMVWNDLNGDGIMDEGESGVAGIEVQLSGDAADTTTTGEDGSFAFEELAMGTYSVLSVGPEGWVLTTESPIQVVLESNDAVFEDADFGWMEETTGDMASIGGIVYNDLNGNAVQDEGEPGVEGIKVDLSGAAEASVNTGADGSYIFSDLDLGEYEVTSNGPDGWVVTTGDTLSITIETADQVVDDAHFGWMEESTGDMASIGGIVFNDMNGNKVQDEGEPGVEGITVNLNGTSLDMTTTAADGSYSFTGLGIGEYKVESVGPDGWVVTTDAELTVKIETADQVVDDAHFGWMEETPGGNAVISGLVWNDLNGDGVVDEGEAGVEGIEINLSGDATATATTAADGTYEFTGLMAGTYQVVSVGPEGWVLTTASPINVELGSDDAVFDLGLFGWMEEVTP